MIRERLSQSYSYIMIDLFILPVPHQLLENIHRMVKCFIRISFLFPQVFSFEWDCCTRLYTRKTFSWGSQDESRIWGLWNLFPALPQMCDSGLVTSTPWVKFSLTVRPTPLDLSRRFSHISQGCFDSLLPPVQWQKYHFISPNSHMCGKNSFILISHVVWDPQLKSAKEVQIIVVVAIFIISSEIRCVWTGHEPQVLMQQKCKISSHHYCWPGCHCCQCPGCKNCLLHLWRWGQWSGWFTTQFWLQTQ